MRARPYHKCLLVLGMAACSHASKAPSVEPAAPRASRNRDMIVQTDMDADPTLRAESVLDVIRALRPQFLNDRGTVSAVADPEAGKVHASIDNGRIIPLSDLRNIHGNQVVEIRYLNIAQAMQLFGTAARQGPIILVKTVVK